MSRPQIMILSWFPDEVLPRWRSEFTECDFVDGRHPAILDSHLAQADITYGQPPVNRLHEATQLRWIQLTSAGVSQELCPLAKQQRLVVTNLAGLYGPSIAEHAFALMAMLARNLQIVVRNQQRQSWDRSVAKTMTDLQGKTISIVGLGNIGQSIARLAKAYGMRIVGCRRTDNSTPGIDRQYPLSELQAMLAEGDYVAVAAPLTAQTTGMLGKPEFAAMKRGAVYINISRGPVAEEFSLIEALRTGHLSAAGMDVFTTEPLPPGHPLWEMPQVIVSPHYTGETINQSARPAERFARNLRSWLANGKLEGIVDLDWGY